jgi:hypothetical protein
MPQRARPRPGNVLESTAPRREFFLRREFEVGRAWTPHGGPAIGEVVGEVVFVGHDDARAWTRAVASRSRCRARRRRRRLAPRVSSS